MTYVCVSLAKVQVLMSKTTTTTDSSTTSNYHVNLLHHRSLKLRQPACSVIHYQATAADKPILEMQR